MAYQKDDINAHKSAKNFLADDYLIFGQVELGWGCRVSAIYMISNGKLYADTTSLFCKTQENYFFLAINYLIMNTIKLKPNYSIL